MNRIGVFVAMMISCGYIRAQSIINTSSISHDLDSTVSIILDAGGAFSRGNSKVDQINVNTGLGKSLGEDASLWLLGGFNELRGNGSLLQQTSFVHLRYNLEVTHKSTLNFYTQWQSNSVLDIKSRGLLGSNISFDLTKDQSATVMLGAFRETEFYFSGLEQLSYRLNGVGVVEHKLNDIEIVGFAYYQPSITDLTDFRCIGELSLRFPIAKGLQFNMSAVGRFDSQPHSSLDSWDFGLNTSLRYEFHKS